MPNIWCSICADIARRRRPQLTYVSFDGHNLCAERSTQPRTTAADCLLITRALGNAVETRQTLRQQNGHIASSCPTIVNISTAKPTKHSAVRKRIHTDTHSLSVAWLENLWSNKLSASRSRHRTFLVVLAAVAALLLVVRLLVQCVCVCCVACSADDCLWSRRSPPEDEWPPTVWATTVDTQSHAYYIC